MGRRPKVVDKDDALKKEGEEIDVMEISSEEDENNSDVDDEEPNQQIQKDKDESQRTHYFLQPNKRHKKRIDLNLSNVFNTAYDTKNKTPFTKLLDQRETDENIQHRYRVYEKIWENQYEKIEFILNNTNNDLFELLYEYVSKPMYEKSTNTGKLPIGFLSLGSNTANNLRILLEFDEYLQNRNNQGELKVVNLNSKNCANMKATLRELIRQFFNLEHSKKNSKAKDEEDPVDENDEEDSGEDEEDKGLVQYGGRITYDFDVIEDWCSSYFIRNNLSINDSNFKVVIIIQDSDSVNNEILNQLVKFLHSYTPKVPINLFMALSSNNVSGWINSNLNNQNRTIINGVKFSSNDNKNLGYRILADLFLNHEVSDDNPISLDSRLSLIILNRFENANNSIDSLISELKLCYMIYFYQLPLSSLVDSTFQPTALHIDCLRKLPSFKKLIEYKLSIYNASQDLETANEIKELLSSDTKVIEVYFQAQKDFQAYRNAIINSMNLLHRIDGSKKQKFEIYKLITNNQLINSMYMTGCMKDLKTLTLNKVVSLINYVHSSTEIRTQLSDGIRDIDMEKLSIALGNITTTDEEAPKMLQNYITVFFNDHSHLNKKVHDNLFHELFTFDGGVSELELTKPPVTIEESRDNLMINLVRPKLRAVLELALEDSTAYLLNELVETPDDRNSKFRVAPMVSKLYNIFKEAPVAINIYDFYVAFKQSLSETAIIDELKTNSGPIIEDLKSKLNEDDSYLNVLENITSDDETLRDETWDKLTFAWFTQSCFELMSFGLMKEKTRGDFLEKAVWKGL